LNWRRKTPNASGATCRTVAYFEEGEQYFGGCVRGVSWAQKFVARNREAVYSPSSTHGFRE
jgi:hypothetical protein